MKKLTDFISNLPAIILNNPPPHPILRYLQHPNNVPVVGQGGALDGGLYETGYRGVELGTEMDGGEDYGVGDPLYVEHFRGEEQEGGAKGRRRREEGRRRREEEEVIGIGRSASIGNCVDRGERRCRCGRKKGWEEGVERRGRAKG